MSSSNGGIYKIHRERPKENLKHLGSMKADEKKLEDVPCVRNFPKVFPEDLTRLPPLRQIKFRIDLILEATPLAKAPYRLAPSEKQELLYSNTSTLSTSLK
ncbi:hypothetical protein Tco_0491187 [Tanacetum coccineum]